MLSFSSKLKTTFSAGMKLKNDFIAHRQQLKRKIVGKLHMKLKFVQRFYAKFFQTIYRGIYFGNVGN